jgi:hypothetical protein
MTPAIVVSLLIIVPTLAALHHDPHLISYTPYNNRHSDAAGAREDHLD